MQIVCKWIHMGNVTTIILLDTRRVKQNGFYPVKLRITHNRKQVYYTVFKSDKIALEMDINYFNDLQKLERPRKAEKDILDYLKAYEVKAQNIIKKIENFSFVEFEKLFLSISGASENIFVAFIGTVKKLENEGRPGTANSYNTALSSLKKYTKKDELLFSEITPDFLNSYEKYMVKMGKTITTVGIYLRYVRALFNNVIKENTDKKYSYPFGKNKYVIPGGSNIKKALTLADIEKIYKHLPPAGTMEQWGRDIWVFSYLCNGLNIADISRLKYKDMRNDTLTFLRKKTELSGKANAKKIEVVLVDEALKIIERWGNKPQKADAFIFPILKDNLTPQQELATVMQTTKNINKHINRIAENLGIKEKVTTYTARHSFATVLKRSGVSIEFISESLGHSDLKVTENYLGSFETDKKREVAKNLTNF